MLTTTSLWRVKETKKKVTSVLKKGIFILLRSLLKKF